MTDLEAHLRAQESEVSRDREIARVLRCSPSDYFAIMEINPLSKDASLSTTLRKAYRKKSLQIHPDKVKNQDAPKAFDLLKKANLVLLAEPQSSVVGESPHEVQNEENESSGLDEKARYAQKTNLISIYEQISKGLASDRVDDFHHKINQEIREKVSLVLEQHERDKAVEKDYVQRQELRKQSDFKTAAKERELKKSWETQWEQNRDNRVKSWRTFSTKVEKPKKKKKKKVLA